MLISNCDFHYVLSSGEADETDGKGKKKAAGASKSSGAGDADKKKAGCIIL